MLIYFPATSSGCLRNLQTTGTKSPCWILVFSFKTSPFFLVHTIPGNTAFPFNHALWQKNTFYETSYCSSFYRGFSLSLSSPVAMVILTTTEALVSHFINSLEQISTLLFLCLTADVGPNTCYLTSFHIRPV